MEPINSEMSAINDQKAPPAATTLSIPSKHDHLTVEQLKALELHILGKSLPEIAETLNVSRTTILRWRKNPHYRAEYNRFYVQLRTAASNRLNNLTLEAVASLEKHVRGGSLKAAIELFKLTGLYGNLVQPSTETDPGAILQQQVEAEYNKILSSDIIFDEYSYKGREMVEQIRDNMSRAQDLFLKRLEEYDIPWILLDKDTEERERCIEV